MIYSAVIALGPSNGSISGDKRLPANGEFGPEGSGPVGNRPDDGRDRGDIGLPFGMVKTLVIVSIIPAIYSNGSKLFKRMKHVPAKAG